MKRIDGKINVIDGTGESAIGRTSQQVSGRESLEALLRRLETELPDVFDREMVLAGAQLRKLNTPRTETAVGTVRGVWKGSSFKLDDSYISEKYNDSKRTVGAAGTFSL